MARAAATARGFLAGGLALALLGACDDKSAKSEKAAAPPAPTVVVAPVVQETVPLVRQYVGVTQAVKTVDVRSKVEGYLEEREFTEGADVKTGDVLFVIDQRPFKAAVEQSQADVNKNEANLAFAKKQVERYKPLVEKQDVSKQTFDGIVTQEKAAEAALAQSQAELKNAELNLGYTTIMAPIDGRIGETLVNIGNLISVNDTLMATLVQLDPIYVIFSPSETQFLEIQKYKAKGQLEYSIVLADKSTYPQKGKLDFVDNQVDQPTGTLRLRAVFPNPNKALLPGQYAEVQVQLADQADTLVVPAPAVGENEGGNYVFVVTKDNKVEQRQVKLGEEYKTGRVVESGLKAGERVVVEGIQKVHDGQVVKVEEKKASGQSASQ
ncbi:MAG: efflux RND transporter periplasmic adaptor subunit [Pseudomonadota bacterium]